MNTKQHNKKRNYRERREKKTRREKLIIFKKRVLWKKLLVIFINLRKTFHPKTTHVHFGFYFAFFLISFIKNKKNENQQRQKQDFHRHADRIGENNKFFCGCNHEKKNIDGKCETNVRTAKRRAPKLWQVRDELKANRGIHNLTNVETKRMICFVYYFS